MNVSGKTVWQEQVHQVLPRVLALFDTNPVSRTVGYGDRYHWGWKLIDFPNATYQGAVHGWARLLSTQTLPPWVSADRLLQRISQAVQAAGRMRRSDGSCEEAFPYESSFCVTALVAYDLLSAARLLADRSPQLQRDILNVTGPMIDFLDRADETHGIISNHLAAAVAALVLWSDRSGSHRYEDRARKLLDRIQAHRSAEGWLREYDGADPGYQTLAMDYLVDVHELRPGWGLESMLSDGCRFLTLAVQPDGSFGGPYGSRNTRLYAPGGLARLAAFNPDAAAIDAAMQDAVRTHCSMSLTSYDDSNLIPMFNSYVRASGARQPVAPSTLPCHTSAPNQWTLAEAGLIVVHRPERWTVVSMALGGAGVQVDRDGSPGRLSGGVLARDDQGRYWGSQTGGRAHNVTINDAQGELQMDVDLVLINQLLPSPLRFVALRILNLTVMRWRPVAEWVKRMLVRLLITGAGRPGARIRRKIYLDRSGSLPHDEVLSASVNLEVMPAQNYSARHMASQGYWQLGDEQ